MSKRDETVVNINDFRKNNTEKTVTKASYNHPLSKNVRKIKVPRPTPNTERVSHILSDDSNIPLSCNSCGCYSAYSLAQLKEGTNLHCPHCLSQFNFSAIELQILKNVLEKNGYFFNL